MPPKRKLKATKAGSTTSFKTPPGKRHSAVSKQPSELQSSQSGSKSRLAPSVPFQMTTRRGARTTSNHTSSAASSSASSGSRRSSLNDIAPYKDALSDLEDERPAKRSRTSTDSGSSQMSNGSIDDNNTPMNQAQSPELQKAVPSATLAAPKAAAKRRRASDESTQSSKTLSARPNGVLTRTHSDVSEQHLRRKKRKPTEIPADSADQPPELTDASTAPNSPEQIPDVDSAQGLQNLLPTNGDAPAKTGRRLPGRRRQPHSDINVEVDLRRQLNLKMSYRSLAKVQKTLLEELSNRTSNNLERDENYHMQCPEYAPLMAELDQRRDSRLDQVNALRTYKLEQLERVKKAEEQIQKEQYINRFKELQDDFLLQCYFRMKRLEREAKGEAADATDDEDNVLPPTYTDEPHHNVDDRIGSKYASRSRAYVEAEKELMGESVRRRFDRARATYVENDEDADDSIEFARFTGPDRAEALAHHNIASLVDAVFEVEKTPPVVPVIPNEQASMLMLLADVSSKQQQAPPPRAPSPAIKEEPARPAIKEELTRQMSPVFAPQRTPVMQPGQIVHASPGMAFRPTGDKLQETSRLGSNGVSIAKEAEETKHATPARVSTHRIMDILNSDQDVPVSKVREYPPRESQPPILEPHTPSQLPGINQYRSPSQSALRVDAILHREVPVDQALMDALSGGAPPPNRHATSPPTNTPAWPRPNMAPSSESEDALRRRDPLYKLRELFDKKGRDHGREPPERSQPEHWNKPDYSRFRQSLPGHVSDQERPGVAQYDPTRPAAGLYSQSPNIASAFGTAARRGSQDQGAPHWDQGRRMSASQAPQQPATSPYQGSQAYPGEHKRALSPPTHQSPYAPAPGPMSLPPKPPGPLPSAPISYRFAHYDPVPPRPSYPPQSPSFPPSSHASHASHASHGPPVVQAQPPTQPQYAPAYAAPLPYNGYVPPGSFQAPPPPPPHAPLPPYPPLKIHQYGGQPILPANMAPPPPHSGPPMTFVGQQVGQAAYSPTQSQAPGGLGGYEGQGQGQSQQRSEAQERPPEPQARPRRQYRSYHAPGTQFRSYQGPGGGRRGG